MINFLFWLFCHLLTRVLFRIEIEDQRKVIPPKTIYIANHVTTLDWLIIKSALTEEVLFVSHKSFVDHPCLGKLLQLVNCIPIAGDLPSIRRAFRQINGTLKAGKSICIFPEGQLTTNGQIAEFRPGILKIHALNEKTAITPLTLSGFWDTFWSKKNGWFYNRLTSFRFHRPVVKLTIHEQIRTSVFAPYPHKLQYLRALVKMSHHP